MDEAREFCFAWVKGKKQKQYKNEKGVYTCEECGYMEADIQTYKKHCEEHRNASEITRSDTRRRKRSKTTTELKHIMEPQQQQQQQNLPTHEEKNDDSTKVPSPIIAAVDTATPAPIPNEAPTTTPETVEEKEKPLDDTTSPPLQETSNTTLNLPAAPAIDLPFNETASTYSFLLDTPILTPTPTPAPSTVVEQPRYFNSYGNNILQASTWSAIKDILGKRSLGDHALELAQVITIIERDLPNALILVTPPADELEVITKLPAAMGRTGITIIVREHFLEKNDIIEEKKEDEFDDGEVVTWKKDVKVLWHKRVMLVQLKDVGTMPFLETCEKLSCDHRLQQIVVEASHLLIHTSQKQAESMRNAGMILAKLHARLILLSNHLPLYAEHALKKIIPVPTWQVVRTTVSRPNIRIVIKYHLAADLSFEKRYRKLSFEVEAMRRAYPGKKGIVFVPSYEVNRVATKLNLKALIPGFTELWHQQVSLWLWMKEDEAASAVLVAPYGSLSSLGRSDVAFCVHLNEPPNILDFASDLATLQRSGGVGTCTILIPKGSARSALKGYEDYVFQSGQQAIWRVVDCDQCRQLTLGQEMSDNFGMECTLLGGELCDLCKERLGEDEDAQGVEEGMELMEIVEEAAVEESEGGETLANISTAVYEQITLPYRSSPAPMKSFEPEVEKMVAEVEETAKPKKKTITGAGIGKKGTSGREMKLRAVGAGKPVAATPRTTSFATPSREDVQEQQQRLQPQQEQPQQQQHHTSHLPKQAPPQHKPHKQALPKQLLQQQKPPQGKPLPSGIPPNANAFFDIMKYLKDKCTVCFLNGNDYNHPAGDCDSGALSDKGLHSFRREFQKAMGKEQGWLGCLKCVLPIKHCPRASEEDPATRSAMTCEYPTIITSTLWKIFYHKDEPVASKYKNVDEFVKWAASPADEIWVNRKTNQGFYLAIGALWEEWKDRGLNKGGRKK